VSDLDRLRYEYADRSRRLAGDDRYSPFNPAALYTLQQRQRATMQLLPRLGLVSLDRLRILEMGCGAGGVLLEYLSYGAEPAQLFGIDLLPTRLVAAHHKLPHLSPICADGQNIPYPADCFDLALQYTAFSSILDDQIKANLARELMRVLKPGGWILWYDFWLNPTNRQTRGIRPSEIRRLFPGCKYIYRKATLAPPIARWIVPISWPFALLLESLKIFDSHYLAGIQKLAS
jgi:SAM-dependent methyltransferase